MGHDADLPADMRALFESGGATGQHMLTVDWARTPLGPVAGWQPSLRTAVSIVLPSRHPLLIWWGPQLAMLYNDALVPSIGAKHPHAVGRPGFEMFPEMWDVIGPMLTTVMSTGVATWRYDEPLPMDRRGFLEDTYWTYSYSPILDEAGAVAGVFTATSETTDRVLRERRLGILQEQARATEGARSTAHVCQATALALALHPADLPYVAIYVRDEQGAAHLAATTPSCPDSLPTLIHASDLDATLPVQEVLASRRLTVTEAVDTGRAVLVPVIPPGPAGPAAVLVAGVGPTIFFDKEYERFLADIAGRLANAIADVSAYTAQRLRADALSELNRVRLEASGRERLIADELQRSLLPSELGDPPGLQVAVHYRAGEEGTQVGGDWYDVIPLGDTRTGLVIGDVMGRGVQAAAVMGQLRTAIRAYALLDLGPARVLTLLDTLVQTMPHDHIATCVYAVYDAADRSLTFANAGHPPPMLHVDGADLLLEEGTASPLGAGAVDAQDTRLQLSAGTVLALYTDGLVERRGTDIDAGLTALQALLREPTGSAEPFAGRPGQIVETLRPGGVSDDDDIALLLVQVSPGSRPRGHVARSLELPAEHQSARAARRFVRSVIEEVERPDWRDAAELAVSELVTNALLHAHTIVRLAIAASPDLLHVAVHDLNPSLPARRGYDDQASTGRGMALVEAVTTSHGVQSFGADGKAVWFTIGEGTADPSPFESVPRTAGGPTETPHVVILKSLPATLWLAARQHHDALLRELALSSPTTETNDLLASADAARRTISETLDRALALARSRGQARKPLPADHPGKLPEVPVVLHLELSVAPAAAPQFAALQDALDQAERLAAAGLTLSRPGLPEIVAVRDWACEQVIAQLAGAPPAPWPGTAADRFANHRLDPSSSSPDWDTAGLEARWGVAADDANRILGISPGLAECLGWSAEALVGRRVVVLVPARFREAHVAGFTRHLTTGEAHAIGVELQLPVLRADGSEITCTFLIESHSAGARTIYVAWITPPPG